MRTFIASILGMLLGALLTAGGIVAYAKLSKPEPPPAPALTCPPMPDPLSWFDASISRCDSVCGPVPFEVTVSKDSIKCTCGRPLPVVKARVSNPKLAESP